MSDFHMPESSRFKRYFRFARKSAFCLCFSSLVLMAESAYAQSAKVTIDRKDVQIESILNDIESQTDYLFVYKRDVDVKGVKTLTVKERPVSEILAQLFAGSSVTWKMEGNHIFLIHGKNTSNQSVKQSKDVKGKVVDATGEPVIGATVTEEGTTNGTITDFDGNFTLPLSDDGALLVSFIGYKPQTIKPKGSEMLQIVLKEDNQMLDEVVVVGFGTQKKVNLTGSVSVISAEEIQQRPVANVTQALQGMIPGLQITQSNGSLEDTPSINVRGTTTIGQGTSGSPLILIDGLEGDLNTISPQDIASISVLKDAAASSIYGSRAPFGVILITTKSGGEEGKVTINYNNSFRFGNPINMNHMMNSVDLPAG